MKKSASRLRRGLYLASFDELSDPRTLVELAVAAEEAGWDGVFLWDHILWRAPVRAVADPWVALSAIAAHTERVRLGPLVTPLARRRVQKLARETATLDHLSRGRLTLGVGLGSSGHGDLKRFGEVVEPRERARLLDDGLARLVELWAGEFEPRPVQTPRIPSGSRAAGRIRAHPSRRRLGRHVPDRAARAGGARRARRRDRAAAR